MLRTPRCLNNVSSKARKCKSVTRGVKRHSVAVRPRSLARHTGVKHVIPVDIEIEESLEQRQTQQKLCQEMIAKKSTIRRIFIFSTFEILPKVVES